MVSGVESNAFRELVEESDRLDAMDPQLLIKLFRYSAPDNIQPILFQ
jgi:hypothetical protein